MAVVGETAATYPCTAQEVAIGAGALSTTAAVVGEMAATYPQTAQVAAIAAGDGDVAVALPTMAAASEKMKEEGKLHLHIYSYL